MGAGASAAAPHDVALLVACIDSLKLQSTSDLGSGADAKASIMSGLWSTHLASLGPEVMEKLIPVLGAAIDRYVDERALPRDASHADAAEAALAAAHAAFTGATSPPPQAVASPGSPQRGDEPDATPPRRAAAGGRGRFRRGDEAPPPPPKPMLFAQRAAYEAAEIGGGTVYTTELTLYEGGNCELGSHDVGQTGRQMHLRRTRGDSFTESMYWGGYEYYTGRWEEVAPRDADCGCAGGAEPHPGRSFRVVLDKARTQPSDPYCSERTIREGLALALTVTIELREGVPSGVEGAGVLADLRGAPGGARPRGPTARAEAAAARATAVAAAAEAAAEAAAAPGAAPCLVLSEVPGDLKVRFTALRVGPAPEVEVVREAKERTWARAVPEESFAAEEEGGAADSPAAGGEAS